MAIGKRAAWRSWWHPGFSKDVLTKGPNNSPGTVRALTIKDGPTFTEELISFTESTHTYGTTTVTWSAKFTRKNSADNPPAGETDDAAVKLITGVFQAGLANLKKQTES
jgi:hypothetical protein